MRIIILGAWPVTEKLPQSGYIFVDKNINQIYGRVRKVLFHVEPCVYITFMAFLQKKAAPDAGAALICMNNN